MALTGLAFRDARRGDLPRMVEMLAEDPLGSRRERADAESLPAAYLRAFEAIDGDPCHQLLVATRAGRMVGFLQLSFLPNLTYQGGWRAQVEGVRVDSECRGLGIGRALLEEAVRRAAGRGCRMVQLTTDKARPEALRFYESLGFVASHEGMKLHL